MIVDSQRAFREPRAAPPSSREGAVTVTGAVASRASLGLDLSDPLTGHAELSADLLEGPGVPVGQTEPQLDQLLLLLGNVCG